MVFTRKIVPISATDKLPKLRFRPEPTFVTDNDWVGATTLPIERFRKQRGQSMVFADGHLYARFYEGTGKDRKKVSRRIADKGTFESKDYNELLAGFMERVNDGQRNAWTPQIEQQATVASFFVNMYMPTLKQSEASWSTVDTYARIWKTYCADYFRNVRLTSFSTKDASAFLRSLAKKGCNRSTINIVKACVRNAFRYAVSEEIRKDDPFEKAEIFGVKVRPKPKHIAYTNEEIKTIAASLPNVKSRLLFLLCSRPGLRPAEVAGCKWEDIDWQHKRGVVLHIRRSAPKGHVQETAKTAGSERLILLSAFPDVMALLEKHKARSNGTGYVFKRRSDSSLPINASKYCSDVIADPARKAIGKDRWRGLYAGRRAMVTAMIKLTGKTTDASATAGHKNIGTTEGYVELLSEDGFDAQKALGASYSK